MKLTEGTGQRRRGLGVRFNWVPLARNSLQSGLVQLVQDLIYPHWQGCGRLWGWFAIADRRPL